MAPGGTTQPDEPLFDSNDLEAEQARLAADETPAAPEITVDRIDAGTRAPQ